MKINQRLKLVYFNEPLNIKILSTNENSKEYLFDLDNNQGSKLTFEGGLEILDNNNQKLDINNIVSKFEIIDLENCFLFYSYYYQISYCHYITQTLPKLYDYLINYNKYKLLIPKIFYNSLCKEILDLLNINNIYILEENKIYNIKNLICIKHYQSPPSNFTTNHLNIYNLLRDKINMLSLKPNENSTNYNRLIYLKRDGIPNKDYGNSETGILRQIINENELIDYLKNKNFEIITLGDKSLKEKYSLLKNSKILITPLGANCMNLIFSDCPKNVIVLSNDNNFGFDYYINLMHTLTNTKSNNILIKCKTIYNNDKLNRWNGSFKVDINMLNNILINMNC